MESSASTLNPAEQFAHLSQMMHTLGHVVVLVVIGVLVLGFVVTALRAFAGASSRPARQRATAARRASVRR